MAKIRSYYSFKRRETCLETLILNYVVKIGTKIIDGKVGHNFNVALHVFI